MKGNDEIKSIGCHIAYFSASDCPCMSYMSSFDISFATCWPQTVLSIFNNLSIYFSPLPDRWHYAFTGYRSCCSPFKSDHPAKDFLTLHLYSLTTTMMIYLSVNRICSIDFSHDLFLKTFLVSF